MGTIERSVEVGRSAADVWTVLEDVRRIPTYSPSTVAVSDAPERLSAVGQRFRQTVVVLGRRFESDWTVTELQPGRRVGLEGTVGVGARYCLVEEVEPRGPDRSRLTVRITFTMPLDSSAGWPTPSGLSAAPSGRPRRSWPTSRPTSRSLAGVDGRAARAVGQRAGDPGR